MQLVLMDCDDQARRRFHPLSLGRPIWELRCGITTLAEKLIARLRPAAVACFVPEYMAAAQREQSAWPVNDPASLAGDGDLIVADAALKADAAAALASGPSRTVAAADGRLVGARIAAADRPSLPAGSLSSLLDAASRSLPRDPQPAPVWQYVWELILANPEQLAEDFAALGRRGVEGTLEQPHAVRGSDADLYVAPGARIHPMVVIDCEHGPVYIDRDVIVHPFTRIEGPCYVGPQSWLLGAKCREGNSIGPCCRIGGEVEESIIQGYSNKYHDGFLGHAYVGQWVNLGALTTNSDLKNDYSTVSVVLDGRTAIDTGSTKVGSLIGDHAKTAIGTMLNTGAYVGAMSLIAASGKLLPKFLPSFSWFIDGVVTKGFGRKKLYETARTAMGRRKQQWTQAQEAMWDAVFEMTAPARQEAIKKGRRAMLRS